MHAVHTTATACFHHNTNKMRFYSIAFLFASFSFTACNRPSSEQPADDATGSITKDSTIIQPFIVTDSVVHDTDDPAIWINPEDPSKSLIVGTDKDADGGLYVFDLAGKVQKDKFVKLKRPNNVDIAYGLMLSGKKTDIAVATEREANKIRIFTLPDMKVVDAGGIEVFKGDSLQAPMGIALYTRPSDKAIFAIVGRKSGPAEGYLWQYKLSDDGKGNVKAVLVRKFGKYSGKKEIESIAVDNEMGYVYYSDEQVGVRKYYADPDSSSKELTLIPNTGFTEDNEGISIYKTGAQTGYILISDQGADKFHIFKREGTEADPHAHELVKIVKVAAHQSDGSDVTNVALSSDFPKGLLVVMSEGKVFHYYKWEDIFGKAN
ncbi:phytase [Dyadobacter chenwenxiniae]|uniref:Phytase n=1 Tax=Dyadobacter chenwenxiniae TaxID=2906456 RepID=A0A9X1PQM1_9BACT|nr:phytase [Dyadobacter chenwenxiniae]MCF0065243.1 phytase [Dyadobacter chenwenxiniae]UON84487.1 phytase [Dyadobacter chenwenxiniae]